ncbi:hypothetical protein [Anaerosporobacter sp.]|uniref:hypothetical protein n=1 Tax=Anaerosporobacter sp. TaxID=1872529 RepID=UPI00286FA566|nr:hypothetical protein [Anaerosporobacter sp.]
MRFFGRKKKDKATRLEERKVLEPTFAKTIEVKDSRSTKDGKEETEEYEIVECTIYPEKVICPDCGGITLEGLDFCDKCGGELYDMGE